MLGAVIDRTPRNDEAERIVHEIFEDPEFNQNPWPRYARLQELFPAYYSHDRGHWMITGRQELEKLLASPKMQALYDQRMDLLKPDWRNHPGTANPAAFPALRDGQEHREIRRTMMPTWTPAAVEERFREPVRRIATKLVKDFAAKGGGDFSAEVAFPFGIEVIGSMFKLPEGSHSEIREQVSNLMRGFIHNLSEEDQRVVDEVHVVSRAYWQEEVRKRAADASGDDLLSVMVRESGLPLEEVGYIAEIIFIGGFENTAGTLSTGLWHLARDRTAWDRVATDEPAFKILPEEMLRIGASAAMSFRTCAETVPIGEYAIQEGDVAFMVFSAANRDPRVFDNPNTFDVTRAPFRSVAFGHGAHMCVGMWLARLELRELSRAMLDHCKNIEVRDEYPRFTSSPNFRFMEKCDIIVNA